jgi:hypothetical protein
VPTIRKPDKLSGFRMAVAAILILPLENQAGSGFPTRLDHFIKIKYLYNSLMYKTIQASANHSKIGPFHFRTQTDHHSKTVLVHHLDGNCKLYTVSNI